MKVLVTGGGGYIGSTLVPTLVAAGHSVRVIDRFFFGDELLERGPAVELIREDIRRVEPGHFSGVDAVIDLAAISNDPSGELFQDATWAINHRGRARIAKLAKESGVARYILPSSCSIYGQQAGSTLAAESSPTNPLTTYARANEQAEQSILPLADDALTVIITRLSTVFGFSPRMRFDLAINGMTFGGWKTGELPLMRDGTQWRPMVHVRDVASALLFLLTARSSEVNGQTFNIGSDRGNHQLGPLAELVAGSLPNGADIIWYGDPDTRSYRVDFSRIEALGWRSSVTAEDGVAEIVSRLEEGGLDRTPRTITLEWYKRLVGGEEPADHLMLHGGLLDI